MKELKEKILTSLTKNASGIIAVACIFGFASFMIHVNTSDQENYFEHPKVGDYYVLEGFDSKGEQIFKIKEIHSDSITFFIPMQELLFGFKVNKSESLIREADAKGEMYSNLTIAISRKDLAQIKQNDHLKERLNGNGVRLEHIFK
jgi:hypothetical protein